MISFSNLHLWVLERLEGITTNIPSCFPRVNCSNIFFTNEVFIKKNSNLLRVAPRHAVATPLPCCAILARARHCHAPQRGRGDGQDVCPHGVATRPDGVPAHARQGNLRLRGPRARPRMRRGPRGLRSSGRPNAYAKWRMRVSSG